MAYQTRSVLLYAVIGILNLFFGGYPHALLDAFFRGYPACQYDESFLCVYSIVEIKYSKHIAIVLFLQQLQII